MYKYRLSSVTQSCPTLCDPMNCSTPGLPVHHQLPEFTQTHAHRVSDAFQLSHPLSSPSPASNPSQHQSLFQRVNSSHEVVKVLIDNRYIWASQVVLVVKNPPASAGDVRDMGLIPGLGRSPGGGHGNPLQYSCLKNLMDRGSWWATVHRVARSWT